MILIKHRSINYLLSLRIHIMIVINRESIIILGIVINVVIVWFVQERFIVVYGFKI